MDSPFNQRNEPLLEDILIIKNEFINNKNSENNFLNSEQKDIIENLILMGFNLEMIDMCFCFFTIVNIEQAVQLMTKEKDIWQHDYIKSENNLCIICNEYCSHINLIIDKEEKLERLRELNDSFNSKFRSSIESLRESHANSRNNNNNNFRNQNNNISENLNNRKSKIFEIDLTRNKLNQDILIKINDESYSFDDSISLKDYIDLSKIYHNNGNDKNLFDLGNKVI